MVPKNRNYLLAFTPHEASVVRPKVVLYCPLLKSKGSRDALYCIYKCPKARRLKCAEYTKKYTELIGFEIPQLYIDRYGLPELLVPLALRKRRKRRVLDAKTETE